MKKIKRYLLSTLFLTILVGFVSTNASACCEVCWGTDCYEIEGDCSDVCCSFEPATCSCTGALAYNPNLDYILAAKDQPVYIVRNGIKTRVATDNMAAFHKELNKKYAKSNKTDPNFKAKIGKEWAGFFKRNDTSKVSAKRLNLISKQSGLKILTAPLP